jgi:peptidoglycan hydrolase-like protein with peptidoglycan-binding domain/3D (Asp-Asp-Asp) domain-containing protein
MKNSRIVKLVVCNLVLLATCFMVFQPLTSVGQELALASDFDASTGDKGYPYEQNFIITAYYSPLPCQDKYVTGSYDGDIRLNGHGIHGADGTDVYPGMIAAPKTYDFGMKLYIPDVGTVAVHDRGGAIVQAGQRNNSYDRLDIWMGFGDKGLKRALNWGKRTVTATMYGVDESVKEEVYLGDYSSDEYLPQECDYSNQYAEDTTTTTSTATAEPVVDEQESLAKKYNLELSDLLSSGLSTGSKGDAVRKLQEELKNMNYYRKDVTGVYDEVTEHAVFKFQQAQGIVVDKKTVGAGVFGPKTRQRLNDMIASRNDRRVLIAQATNDMVMIASNPEMKETTISLSASEGKTLLTAELDFGVTNKQVAVLQKFLKDQGYFDGDITNYFGPSTKAAITEFQKDNGLVKSESDTGAGRVGPGTLNLINNLS